MYQEVRPFFDCLVKVNLELKIMKKRLDFLLEIV